MISKQQERISRSRDFLLSGTIDEQEYNELRRDGSFKIRRYEADLKSIEERVSHDFDIKNMVSNLLSNMENVVNLYINADTSGKRHIVSSLFSGKWILDGRNTSNY